MKAFLKSKKGFALGDLMPIALLFVTTGIAISYGLQVLGDVKGDACTYGSNGVQCLNSTGGIGLADESVVFNATQDTSTAVAKIGGKLGLLVTIVIAAIVLVILFRYLGGSAGSSGRK